MTTKKKIGRPRRREPAVQMSINVKPTTRRWLRRAAGSVRKVGRFLDAIADQ